MTRSEAKQVLLLFRPGGSHADDPEMAQALEQVRHDAELRHWFDEHCALQATVRAKFNEIEVPADAKARLLAAQKIVRPNVWWRQPASWAAAAVVAVLIGLSTVWVKPRTPDRFADYQSRMVRTVLREYRMDIVTNDMRQIRRFMAAQGAPADYVLPTGLEQLQLTGGGLLRWRSKPVAMVCFNRGDNQMLFLFVLDHSAVKDPPPEVPTLSKINKLLTASWTGDGKTYILAGSEEADFVRKYF